MYFCCRVSFLTPLTFQLGVRRNEFVLFTVAKRCDSVAVRLPSLFVVAVYGLKAQQSLEEEARF